MIYTQRIRYRFGDIDHAGIAYYPKILHVFHCVFEDWWSEGLKQPYPKLLQEEKLGLPAVRLEVDFYAPIRYGDEPNVHLGVLNIGDSSVTFGFWMTLSDGAKPACRARIVTAAVHMDHLSKRQLPDVWRERLSQYLLSEADFPSGR